jgi:hypothetical protein
VACHGKPIKEEEEKEEEEEEEEEKAVLCRFDVHSTRNFETQ